MVDGRVGCGCKIGFFLALASALAFFPKTQQWVNILLIHHGNCADVHEIAGGLVIGI